VNKRNEDAKACYKCGSDKHLLKKLSSISKERIEKNQLAKIVQD
jgi:hypothetical protein